MQGITKKIPKRRHDQESCGTQDNMNVVAVVVGAGPGPLAPPDRSLPRRNITALSYSCTTWGGEGLCVKQNVLSY